MCSVEAESRECAFAMTGWEGHLIGTLTVESLEDTRRQGGLTLYAHPDFLFAHNLKANCPVLVSARQGHQSDAQLLHLHPKAFINTGTIAGSL